MQRLTLEATESGALWARLESSYTSGWKNYLGWYTDAVKLKPSHVTTHVSMLYDGLLGSTPSTAREVYDAL